MGAALKYDAAAAARDWMAEAPLEELVTSKHFFGLTTASPAQRAAYRAFEGEPLGSLSEDADVMAMFGGAAPPTIPPFELSWLSGVRVAKSLSAAGAAVRWSQRVVIPSYVGPGEVPRIPILSLDKDKATAVLNHLRGRIYASPLLKMLVLDEPAEGITLRHPSGRPIDVMVMAGKRAGASVVAYWLAGLIFDEFPRMRGAYDDAVVNWDETRAAAVSRILPGGGIMNIGSPHAPFGPAFNQVRDHFGKPTKKLVVMMAPAWVVNPVYWTPERVDDARNDPDFETDVAGNFATPEESFFSVQLVEACMRVALKEPRLNGAEYAAFIDPATRSNAFTLVIVTRRGNTLVVACAMQWIGTRNNPLDTGFVLTEIGAVIKEYGIEFVTTDQYMGDALKTQAQERGFNLYQLNLSHAEKLQRALKFRTKLGLREIELCPVTTWRAGLTETTQHLRDDVKRVRRVVTQETVKVHLPITEDGRHTDFWPPLSMAMGAYLDDVQPTAVKQEDPETRRMRESSMRRYGPKNDEEED